jgi:hypothetical protein
MGLNVGKNIKKSRLAKAVKKVDPIKSIANSKLADKVTDLGKDIANSKLADKATDLGKDIADSKLADKVTDLSKDIADSKAVDRVKDFGDVFESDDLDTFAGALGDWFYPSNPKLRARAAQLEADCKGMTRTFIEHKNDLQVNSRLLDPLAGRVSRRGSILALLTLQSAAHSKNTNARK